MFCKKIPKETKHLGLTILCVRHCNSFQPKEISNHLSLKDEPKAKKVSFKNVPEISYFQNWQFASHDNQPGIGSSSL